MRSSSTVPPMSSTSSMRQGVRPRRSAASSTGLSFRGRFMMAPAAVSRARGLAAASSSPACRGVPEEPGPSPSMARMPSIRLSRGFTYPVRSSNTSAKVSVIRVGGVVAHLGQAGDHPEQVLHRPRHAHEHVGFHLAQVDHPIGLRHGGDDLRLAEHLPLRQGHGAGGGIHGQLRPGGRGGRRHAGLLVQTAEHGLLVQGAAGLVQTAEHGLLVQGAAGAVADHRRAPRLLHQLGHCLHHRRVGADSALRRGGPEQVGLEDNPLPGADEPVHAAHLLHQGADAHLRLLVVRAGRRVDLSFFHEMTS